MSADHPLVTPSADECLPSDDLLAEQSYLVARGVRAMALVGWCEADSAVMLRVATKLESVSDPECVPFVVDHQDGQASFGFVAARWALDLYEWTYSVGVPQEQRERITGLLLGYAPAAVSQFEETSSGRRFLSPVSASRERDAS